LLSGALAIVVILLALAMTRNSGASYIFRGSVSGAFLGGLAVLAVVISTYRLQLRWMQPLEEGCILGSRTLTLGERGINLRAGGWDSFFAWELLRETKQSGEHLFIMFDRVFGVIVPKRAFASESDVSAFISELERFGG
jgi:hypothetical protein